MHALRRATIRAAHHDQPITINHHAHTRRARPQWRNRQFVIAQAALSTPTPHATKGKKRSADRRSPDDSDLFSYKAG
jgi:hypothetical protein